MPNRNRKKIKMAMIGCGGMAGAHLRGYHRILQTVPDKMEIVAVCDSDTARAENFATQTQPIQGSKPRVYAEWDDMLSKEELDGADICTPHGLHHVAGIACLNKGVNVIIEKPFGVTIKASKAIIEAAKKSQKIAATAEQIRRGLSQRTAHWLFNKEKLIGNPRLFLAQHASWGSPQHQRGWHWRTDKILGGGGMVMDSGAHYCDTLRYLFGDLDSAYARVEQLEKWPHKKGDEIVNDSREDTWVATLNFKSGLIGVWSWTQVVQGFDFTQVVYYGTQGALIDNGDVFHGPFGGGLVRLPGGRVRRMSDLQNDFLASLSAEEKERLFPHGIMEQVTLECYDFVDAIQNNRLPEVPGEEGLKAKAIAEAIFESAWSGEAVKYQDVLDGKIEGYQKEINEKWGL